MTNIFDFGLGGPRLRLLGATGATEVTLTLPPTSMGGIVQSFDESKLVDEMLDHSLSVTINGYYHRYKCKWDVYDQTATGLTVGVADANTPTVPQLMQIFTQYRPGRIQFSPSSTASFYTVYLDKMPAVTPVSDVSTAFEFEVKTMSLYSSASNAAAKVLT